MLANFYIECIKNSSRTVDDYTIEDKFMWFVGDYKTLEEAESAAKDLVKKNPTSTYFICRRDDSVKRIYSGQN